MVVGQQYADDFLLENRSENVCMLDALPSYIALAKKGQPAPLSKLQLSQNKVTMFHLYFVKRL